MPGDPNYQVEDGDIPCTTKIEQNYTYEFNVCGPVASIPRACQSLDDAHVAAALQIDSTHLVDYCYITGLYSETATELSLINAEDPSAGMQISYTGKANELCSNHKPRKFHIQMLCADRLNPIPTHALEYSHCEYTVTVPSVYGCPVQCPVANRKLCAGNGHCAYDDDANEAKCFCNRGWTGSDCNEEPTSDTSKNYSPVLLGLIITLFIIVIVLVGAMVLMVRQLAAYKEDITNYQALKGGDEDSANV
jgi:hypothetical protein